jgi:adenylyl-sulfate kinase
MMLSPNVVWQTTSVDRSSRDLVLGMRGATVWFTGLPGSGKSTLATAVEARLTDIGAPAYVLDGDNLRHGLNGDLGFGSEARAENVRRTAHVSMLFADAGLVALVSLVSPYAEDRALARALHEKSGLPFVEAYVNAPATVCEQRDPKGLYARARRGEISGFTGVDAPYEPPRNAEVELGVAPLADGVDAVMAALAEHGVPAARRGG